MQLMLLYSQLITVVHALVSLHAMQSVDEANTEEADFSATCRSQ